MYPFQTIGEALIIKIGLIALPFYTGARVPQKLYYLKSDIHHLSHYSGIKTPHAYLKDFISCWI